MPRNTVPFKIYFYNLVEDFIHEFCIYLHYTPPVFLPLKFSFFFNCYCICIYNILCPLSIVHRYMWSGLTILYHTFYVGAPSTWLSSHQSSIVLHLGMRPCEISPVRVGMQIGIANSRPRKPRLELLVRGVQESPKIMWVMTIILSDLPELKGKTLSLKTLHTLDLDSSSWN